MMSKQKLLLLLIVALSALMGCPDPQETFDEFVDRTGDVGGAPDDLGESRLEDLEGRFLLLASVQLAPSTPLLMDVTVTGNFRDDGTCPSDGCEISLQVQPLVSPQVPQPGNCPPAYDPIGEPFEANGIPVERDGFFLVNLPLVTVDGCANPITGRDIAAELILETVTKSEDVFCGNLKGHVRQPLDLELDRSTFAATRIDEDPQDVDPKPTLMACPEDGGGTGGAGDGAGGDGGTGGTGGDGGDGGSGGA